jgi:ABC-type antimicrobial peptide transport system permease subunit
MNRDVFRLAILGSRGGYGRPLGIITGVAVGVALFLTLLGAANGLKVRDERSAWLNMYFDMVEEVPVLTDSVALVRADIDYFDDQAISRRDVAVTTSTSLAFPWGPVPHPGTYLASPALKHLIDANSADMLGDRYGSFAGLIPDSGLASPDSLVVVIGRSEAELRATGSGGYLTDLSGMTISSSEVYRTIIIIGGIATFIPVLLFVAIVTHLGAAQRSERFSTIRMIGGSPGVVARLAAIEMAILSVIGAILGVGTWLAIQPIAARFPVDQGRFFAEDLGLSITTALAVCLTAVIGTTVVSIWQIKRAGIGPLGVTRQQMESRPSPIRILPLAGGLVLMAMGTRSFLTSTAQELLGLLVIAGFGLIALGIIAVGPWITSVSSRIASRRVSSAAGMIATSTITRHPARTFRSVSGLVVAVFVASVFAGAASSVLDERETSEIEGALPLTTLVAYFHDPAIAPVDERDIATASARISSIVGVTSVVTGWIDIETYGETVLSSDDARKLGVPVPENSTFVGLDLSNALYTWDETQLTEVTPADGIDGLSPYVLLVQTDGSVAAIERARTDLQTSGLVYAANTRSDLADRDTRKFVNSMSNLAYIGIALTILVAGISLSVSTASAIIERKRIFGLLRLVGMPQDTLRNVVIIEALVPLLAVVGLSIGFGFFVAWLIVDGLSIERSMSWPDARYVMTILASTLLASFAVLITVRIARTSTGITATRFE